MQDFNFFIRFLIVFLYRAQRKSESLDFTQ